MRLAMVKVWLVLSAHGTQGDHEGNESAIHFEFEVLLAPSNRRISLEASYMAKELMTVVWTGGTISAAAAVSTQRVREGIASLTWGSPARITLHAGPRGKVQRSTPTTAQRRQVPERRRAGSRDTFSNPSPLIGDTPVEALPTKTVCHRPSRAMPRAAR